MGWIATSGAVRAAGAAAALLLAAAVAAQAQEGPSFDCAKASGSAEEMVCADAELARLDRLLAARFGQALTDIRGLDTGVAEAEAELRASQRGWIGGRDECWKAEDPRGCVEEAYLRREGELVAGWMLEEAQEVAVWACGGNPANEVVTFFFATERPSLRFERGDSIDTGMLVPSGSGARYEGSFGRAIWIAGDSALYREPDPDGREFDCVLTRRR